MYSKEQIKITKMHRKLCKKNIFTTAAVPYEGSAQTSRCLLTLLIHSRDWQALANPLCSERRVSRKGHDIFQFGGESFIFIYFKVEKIKHKH